MTIVLELSPEIEERLRKEAIRRGLDRDTFAHQIFGEALEKTLPVASNAPRIAGLNAGPFWMSEDFNAPLPDSFWLGEEQAIEDARR